MPGWKDGRFPRVVVVVVVYKLEETLGRVRLNGEHGVGLFWMSGFFF
jgi:hypothetical protein